MLNNIFLLARNGMPWWLRIGAKLIISRLPLRLSFLRRVGIFVHGKMDQPEYAVASFEQHLSRLGLCANDVRGRVILELGPGDSIATAVVAAAYGARACLVDVGAFAIPDMSTYKTLSDYLIKIGRPPPDITKAEKLEDILKACEGEYLTNGLNSLIGIQAGTVDYVISRAVLEHIRKHEFHDSMLEVFRILRSGGLCSHAVDLKDHLGGGKSNLRVGNKIWESNFFSNSGFYTNRIQYSDMVSIFNDAGFGVVKVVVDKWESVPIDRKNISRDFEVISDEDLLINSFDVVMMKKNN